MHSDGTVADRIAARAAFSNVATHCLWIDEHDRWGHRPDPGRVIDHA
jgi:hypothetical protein